MCSASEPEASSQPGDAVGDRRHPRVARHPVVRYRNRRLNRWEVFPLKDLSPEGARFLSTESFAPDFALELIFGLPLFSKDTALSVRVRWEKPIYAGRLRMKEYGVKFDSLESDVHDVLMEAVRRYRRMTTEEGSQDA